MAQATGYMKIKCGSWLACESGGSGNDASTDTPPSRASPLPQELRYGSGPRAYEDQMWEQAGLPAKAVGQATMHQLTYRLREQARSHSGLKVWLRPPGIRRSNVGAGLPAKAVGQATNASTDTPPSRASPLPQELRYGLGTRAYEDQMWELACLRRRWVRQRCIN